MGGGRSIVAYFSVDCPVHSPITHLAPAEVGPPFFDEHFSYDTASVWSSADLDYLLTQIMVAAVLRAKTSIDWLRVLTAMIADRAACGWGWPGAIGSLRKDPGRSTLYINQVDDVQYGAWPYAIAAARPPGWDARVTNGE